VLVEVAELREGSASDSSRILRADHRESRASARAPCRRTGRRRPTSPLTRNGDVTRFRQAVHRYSRHRSPPRSSPVAPTIDSAAAVREELRGGWALGRAACPARRELGREAWHFGAGRRASGDRATSPRSKTARGLTGLGRTGMPAADAVRVLMRDRAIPSARCASI
jgi:hypothetical protein